MENEIFEANPNLDCYHQTSDGNVFYTENDAKAYGKTLKDVSVLAFYRNPIATQVLSEELDDTELDAENIENQEEENQPNAHLTIATENADNVEVIEPVDVTKEVATVAAAKANTKK